MAEEIRDPQDRSDLACLQRTETTATLARLRSVDGPSGGHGGRAEADEAESVLIVGELAELPERLDDRPPDISFHRLEFAADDAAASAGPDASPAPRLDLPDDSFDLVVVLDDPGLPRAGGGTGDLLRECDRVARDGVLFTSSLERVSDWLHQRARSHRLASRLGDLGDEVSDLHARNERLRAEASSREGEIAHLQRTILELEAAIERDTDRRSP